jgi:hypothetical protein
MIHLYLMLGLTIIIVLLLVWVFVKTMREFTRIKASSKDSMIVGGLICFVIALVLFFFLLDTFIIPNLENLHFDVHG